MALDLTARLRAEGLQSATWSNGPHAHYAAHDHGYDKVVVVTSGSITFGLPGEHRSIELVVGDRLELPAGTTHEAVVGPAGVTCVEAHLAAGQITVVARRSAVDW